MTSDSQNQEIVPVEEILAQTAGRLFSSDVFARSRTISAEVFPTDAWNALCEAGLNLALLPENAGGFGLAPRDALLLLRHAAEHLANVPFAETLLATWLLSSAGLPIPEGPLTAAPVIAGNRLRIRRSADQWWVEGEAARIPWGRHAHALGAFAFLENQPYVVLLHRSDWQVKPGTNVAGEPRDTLSFRARLKEGAAVPAPTGIGPREFRAVGAATRSLQLAGTMVRVQDMCIQHVQERTQFGRPLAKFQVIQHNLAVLAAAVAAAVTASDIAAEAVAGTVRVNAIAVAKARTSEAASSIAGIAHQVHGAMGFTHEHSLHHATRRLWSWREEFGNEIEWQRLLGHQAAENGPTRLWPDITEF